MKNLRLNTKIPNSQTEPSVYEGVYIIEVKGDQFTAYVQDKFHTQIILPINKLPTGTILLNIAPDYMVDYFRVTKLP